jgi:hypothetical protein
MDYAKESKYMLDGQNIVVDQLAKIIEAIQIGRTTGSLIVTRGEGASYEVGTLVFLKGKMVHGRVGRREDREAFNWLSTWGRCRYTFVLSITSDTAAESLLGGDPSTFIAAMDEEKVTGPLRANTTAKLRDSSAPGMLPEETAVPYRSKPMEYGLRLIEEKGLSRTHRRLFLLVNGERKIVDFKRLLKLGEFEVHSVLYELQNLGIISIPSPLSF